MMHAFSRTNLLQIQRNVTMLWSHGAAKQAALFTVPLTAALLLSGVVSPDARAQGPAEPVKRGRQNNQARKRALEMMTRMIQATLQNTYQAREISSNANGRETEQWVRWDPKRGMRREAIRPDDGEVLIDNRKKRWFFSPKDKVWFESDSVLPKPGGRIKDVIRRLNNGELEAEVVGEDKVAGRLADIVRVAPPQGVEGSSRKFWLDRATGLRLKSEEMGMDGRVYASSYYISLKLSPRFSDKDFERPSGEIRPAMDREHAWGPKKRYTSIEEAVKAGVSVAQPNYLPAGFTLRQVEVGGRDDNFITLRYANGLSVISLIQTPRMPLPPHLAEKFGEKGAGFVPNPRGGSDRMYFWRRGEKTYLLFTSLPDDQVKRIAKSVR